MQVDAQYTEFYMLHWKRIRIKSELKDETKKVTKNATSVFGQESKLSRFWNLEQCFHNAVSNYQQIYLPVPFKT